MARYYTKQAKTGREYVYAMHAFADITVHRLEQLPVRWEEDYLRPAKRQVMEADDCVLDANSAWVNPKDSMESYRTGLEERIKLNGDALKHIRKFDHAFERLLRQMDMLESESERLRKIFLKIVEEEMAGNENLSKIDIKVIQRMSEYEYKSASGGVKTRLAMTRRQKDTILAAEAKAVDLITERLTKDRAAYKSITKPITPSGG